MTKSTDLTISSQEDSAASAQRKRMDALIAAVQQRADQLSVLLRDTGIPFDKFVEVFRRALIKNPDLLRADAGSVIEACINACTDGLLPDGRQGAIVIYNSKVKQRGGPDVWVKKAQWQPMYQGMLDVAYRSGNFRSITARVVYAGDEYSYKLGMRPEVTHVPRRRPAGETPEIVAAYAVALTKDGGEFFEPFEGDDIRKVNAVSKATSGPGKDWPEEMARKGPLRRMWKYLPKDDRMNRIVERDNDILDLDPAEYEEQAPAKVLRAGFAPKPAALPQGADQVVDVPMDQGPAEDDMVGAKSPDEEPAAAAQTAAEVKPQPEPAPTPETFSLSLQVAKSWLNIKQALRVLEKERGTNAGERLAAWERSQEMEIPTRSSDAMSDSWLFWCWLESGPSAGQITTTLEALEKSVDWGKLGADLQAKITARALEVSEQ